MPTYEYECSNGHQFEVVQRITDEPLKRCKLCRAKARRLISATSFILKGGGWYSDGYSGGSAGSRNGGSSAGESKKDPGSSSSDSSKSPEKSAEKKKSSDSS
ncbi:MAG: FmdB family zinc ribbon protein [Myxococcota bacterium]